ncbi:Lactonase, 7-bladed beta-propeller-domain-containing protein [Xylariales sp. AK1849]|nr:Lactonase, 7-bladed beta-propeller-domain-containing protein [Xylariales sp. AK1849]
MAFDFDGTTFKNTANVSEPGTSASWMIFKAPNLLYAVDENSNSTRLYNFDPDTSKISPEPVSVGEGSAGVVSLAFNQDQTRLLGASYSQGQVDVWDISAENGSLKLLKQVVLEGPTGPNTASQGVHRAHQAVLDPTGSFFAIADLGVDAVHFIDAKNFEITSTVNVEPAGAGPRHGAFIGGSADTLPTHYVVACEMKNILVLFEVAETDDGKIAMTNAQTLSTYGDAFPPANETSAAAGELLVASNQKDIYVSNRLTGNDTDSISHFVFEDGKMAFVDQISSGGLLPRMMSLSADESLLFCANQNGTNGFVALKRCDPSGSLTDTPEAVLINSEINYQPTFGPQFVMEISCWLPKEIFDWVDGVPQWVKDLGHIATATVT